MNSGTSRSVFATMLVEAVIKKVFQDKKYAFLWLSLTKKSKNHYKKYKNIDKVFSSGIHIKL